MRMLNFIESLGSLVFQMFDRIIHIEQDFVLECIADIVLDLCEKIDNLVVFRDI